MGLLIGAPSAFAIAHLSPPDAMGSTAEHAALARLRDPPESESSTTRPSAAPPVTFDRAPGGLVDGSGESGDRVEQGGWCCGGVAEPQVRAGRFGLSKPLGQRDSWDQTSVSGTTYRRAHRRQPDDEMISICAELRQGCRQIGHPLGDNVHDGDWWIAAAAIRLGLPLASHDGVFAGAPRLEFSTAAPRT